MGFLCWLDVRILVDKALVGTGLQGDKDREAMERREALESSRALLCGAPIQTAVWQGPTAGARQVRAER